MEENSKLKNSNAKVKEKRPSNLQTENPPKRNTKGSGLSNPDFSQLLPPQSFDINSTVKKIFNEANKIVKLGMEKELALQEKNNTLQNSNETIDNLRKNILHLQMEYEKLDQNYQREISNRADIGKRMDATRAIVESMVQYSNTLASSIKVLEEDKCKIVEYYELIYQGQKEIEEKHKEADKFIKDIDNLIKSKVENLKSSYEKTIQQNSETISQLNRKLSYTGDKLKISGDENEKLQKKMKETQETVRKMEVFLQDQQNLINSKEDAISKLKINLKKLKNHRFKYWKLLKDKKKKISILKKKSNLWRENLERLEDLLETTKSVNKTLEIKNDEWETKFEDQLQEEALRNQAWEARVTALCDKLKLIETECENLKCENIKLRERVDELTKNEEGKQKEIEDLQSDLSRMLNSNLNLQEDLKKLNDETNRKENEIADLETKMAEFGCKLNSESTFYQKEAERYQELVKKLENQLSDAEEKFLLEKNQKEILFSDCESKQENLKIANDKINNLEKLLQDKEAQIKAIELQQTSLTLDGQKALEKLNKDIQIQKVKNKELSKEVEKFEANYSTVKKELQEAKMKISDLEEQLKQEKSLNEESKMAKNELQNTTELFKKEMKRDKDFIRELEEKQRKTEKELTEENNALKTAIDDLKNILKSTEARVEAYKVVVKKLEAEKMEGKHIQGETTGKLKANMSYQEEGSKKQLATLQGQEQQQNKKDLESLCAKIREKIPKKEEFQKLDTKENEQQVTDFERRHQAPSTPVQDSKKLLTTPRKIFTSTPQPGFRNLTPFKKKRDPYEFDSDSSIERFDPEQVLKVFNRQKKDTNKKSKTHK